MNLLKALVPFVPMITPIAARWVRGHEDLILATGRALSPDEMDKARQAGVTSPERIRVSFVEAIPVPGALLGTLGRWTGLVSPRTAGITFGHGIYIRSPFRSDRGLLIHECVHVGQYERLGSVENFLREYLRECLDPGYPFGPLEQEAVRRGFELARKA